MSPATSFPERLAVKVEQQLSSQNVGYLLGAGASCFNGKGYPLAGELWKYIAGEYPDRRETTSKQAGRRR